MCIKKSMLPGVRFVLTLVLLFVGIFGVMPAGASAGRTELIANQEFPDPNDSLKFIGGFSGSDDMSGLNLQFDDRHNVAFSSNTSSASYDLLSDGDDCDPNSGSMWINGPIQSDIANQVQGELSQMGIEASVEARSYGEIDGCDIYTHRGVDFTISFLDSVSTSHITGQPLTDDILPILIQFGKPSLGNVKFISPQGEIIPINVYDETFTTPALDSESLPPDAISRNVYVIVYDPLLSSGQTLRQYMHWNDHEVITQQTIDLFKQASNNEINYTVVDTTVVTSGWPELIDGFSYTEEGYLAVWANPQLHHTPTEVNYNKIVNLPEFDICGRLNRGEIDEVWIYNGPWFGFYESTLVGPGAYWFNSNPVSGSHNCNKLLPIMGPSVERTVSEATENFGHRTESTMKRVYGSWAQNNTSHNWNRFTLVKALSPSYSYGGCGNVHYPVNGTADYDYRNSSTVLSNCDDFANYPNLSDPVQVAQPVTCSTWRCMQIGYFGYWFGHFPAFTGCGTDNVANDWWKYIAGPAYALYPPNACQTDMHFISGNAGVGYATLSYNDGGSKSATVDAYGNYFLMVSNHWSGTVSVSRAGYIFTPASRDYVDVQTDQKGQNHTATMITYTISGNAGLADVTLSYTNGTPKTVTTDSAGNYSFVVPYNWSGTVAPSRTGFMFSPSSRTYSSVQANQSDQHYSPLVSISGNAGISGVTLSYTDGVSKTTLTDSSGNYSLAVSYNWSGTITPSLAGYTFSPPARIYTNLLTSQPGQDYTGTAITYIISGNVGLEGATLGYNDGTPKTVIANENGDYTFTIPYNWSSAVTPSKPGYLFTPVSTSYSSVKADQVAQNYTATIGVIISGNVGIGGAALSYNSGGVRTAIADGNGSYLITVPIGWSGTATPTKSGFSFTPTSRSYSNLQIDQGIQDYAVTPVYTVSGNAGVSGVTLNYMDGGISKSVTSNSSGNYSFNVLAGWSGVVMPSKVGITFEPANRSYTNLQANQSDQNYRSIVMVTNNADSGAGSLRQVITDALAGSTIRFDPSLAGQTITLASTLSINKNLTIDGSGLAPRMEISGGNSIRIFIISSSGGTITLQSLILKNGNAGTVTNGGAILVSSAANVTIMDVSFIENTAYNGGAIYAAYNVNVTIGQSEFISNHSYNAGGAIYRQYGTLVVQTTKFLNNNSAASGGALHLYQVISTIDHDTFSMNSATNGGAIYLQYVDRPATILGNLFSGNTATVNGGAMAVSYVNTVNSVKIENNTLYSNQADNGGALAIKYYASVQNNTFYSNRATNSSGTGGTSILFTTPFTTTLNNNILAHGTGGVDCSVSGTGTKILTGTNNLMDNGSSPCVDLPSTIGSDVVLDMPADHGGSTWTMSLLPDSPALDSGNDASCPATDQRGVTRPQGSHCDIGAYEFKSYVTGMNISAVTATYGSSVNLSATLLADGVGVVGRTVNFSINNSSFGNAITNENGTATLNIDLTGINAGTYPSGVEAGFAGDPTYPAANGSADLIINKITPVVNWVTPADILLGTPLSNIQLNATASVPGTFNYNPPVGTILDEGAVQLLSVNFTPDDIVNYYDSTKNVTINVFTCYPLTLEVTGQGANPVTAPSHSIGCVDGQYRAGELIPLSGAIPDPGRHIGGWTGTDNNASTESTNSVTMPASAHAVSIIYGRDAVILTINVNGSGSVNQLPDPPYLYGDEIQLIPLSTTGWRFDHWEGDLTGTTNPVTIALNGNKTVTAIFMRETVVHSIPLVQGWNMISFKVQPIDTNIASVLTGIEGNYDLVYAWDASGAHAGNGNWLKADNIPFSPDSLTVLNEAMGFWIHMTSADILQVTGTVPQNTNIPLLDNTGGWNLVAYPSTVNGILPNTLVDHGIGTDFSLIYAYHPEDPGDTWKLFDASAPPFVNDLTQLSPGLGYWVKVNIDHTWVVEYGTP